MWRLGALSLLPLMVLLIGCQQMERFYTNVQRSDVFFQAYDDHKYDFLWVFDNSASMAPRREFVKTHMEEFASILNSRKAIDYQMAVVTTDFFNDNGALVTGPGGLQVVKSAMMASPVALFKNLIDSITDSGTSFWEQGLISAKQAVYLHGNDFLRQGVPLVVIVLSDEDDYSCKQNCFGVEPEHNTDWVPYETDYFTSYLKNVKKAENTDTFVFPVVGMDSVECEVASVGQRYMDVASGVGGVSMSGSLCDTKIADSFKNIAQTIADRGVRFKLSNKAKASGFSLYVNHVLVPYSPDNYIFDEATNSIIFTGAVPRNGDIVEVAYSQDTN